MARRIRYRHPHWPGRSLVGTILATGRDGHTVLDDDSGHERQVRHEDVVDHLPEGEAPQGDFGTPGGDYGQLDKAMVLALAPAPSPPLGSLPPPAPGATPGPLLPRPALPLAVRPAYSTMLSGELGALAAPYADQYETGHPADFRYQQTAMTWQYDPHFALARLPGTKEDWAQFDFNHGRHLGFAQRQEPPIIVCRGRDEHYYLLDGNHRVAESYAAGLEHAPAIVGRHIDRHQDAYLPPGFHGRSGVRKSLGLVGEPLILLKSTVRMAQPATMWTARERVHQRLAARGGKGAAGGGLKALEAGRPVSQQAQAWDFPAPVAHKIGHVVQYQRPDMAAPEIGKIEDQGRHGAVVSDHQGRRRKVRHEHIHGAAMAGVAPEERGEAAETLLRLGVPVDELETMLDHGAQDGPNMQLQERVKALIADGAPIRKEGLVGRSPAAVRRLVEHFTGPLPKEDDLPPTKPQKKEKRPTPYADEEY